LKLSSEKVKAFLLFDFFIFETKTQKILHTSF